MRLGPQQLERPLLQRRQVCQQVREALQRQIPLQRLPRAVLALALLSAPTALTAPTSSAIMVPPSLDLPHLPHRYPSTIP